MLIDFETTTDFYWFVGIMLVVEYGLVVLLSKAANSHAINTKKWIEAERKKLEQINNVNNEEEV